MAERLKKRGGKWLAWSAVPGLLFLLGFPLPARGGDPLCPQRFSSFVQSRLDPKLARVLERYWRHPDVDKISGAVATGQGVNLFEPVRLFIDSHKENGVLRLKVLTIASGKNVIGPSWFRVVLLKRQKGVGMDPTLAKVLCGILRGVDEIL
jgi:hypothetical protein